MRSLGRMAALMAFAGIGAALAGRDDELIVGSDRGDDRIGRSPAKVDRSTKPDRTINAGDVERMRLAAERRARKAQRQAQGFVTNAAASAAHAAQVPQPFRDAPLPPSGVRDETDTLSRGSET